MDTISNMITSIRNASLKNKEKVEVPYSNFKLDILKVLKNEGFISSYKIIKDEADKKSKKQTIRITLKYTADRKPVINGIKTVSRPGLRIYRGYLEIPKVRAAYGINVISTSKGVMSDREAKKNKIGGEVICQVW